MTIQTVAQKVSWRYYLILVSSRYFFSLFIL